MSMNVAEPLGGAAEVARRAVAALWPNQESRMEVLSGGLTNANFKVAVPDGTYAVRVQSQDTETLAIDRRAEEAASRGAAAVGVAPAVISALPELGVFVTEFIVGRQPTESDMREPDMLERVVKQIKRLHTSGTVIPATFDPVQVVKHYVSVAGERDYADQDAITALTPVLERVERVLDYRFDTPSHCDLMYVNVLEDLDGKVWIIDWEYAGMTDWRQDLGDLSTYHAYEPEHDRQMLEHYFGRRSDHDFAALQAAKFVCAFRLVAWGAAQVVNTGDPDGTYQEWTEEWLERTNRFVASDELEESLQRLEATAS
jgi:thiamine kinase-like enzyme